MPDVDANYRLHRPAADRPVRLFLAAVENLKRQMFWLEPKEIALLVRQQKRCWKPSMKGDRHRSAAADHHHQPCGARAAGSAPARRRLAGPADRRRDPAQPNFFAAAQLGQDTHDEVCRFNHVRVIASRVRIMQEQELQGWVISFRDKNDINTLSSQLSQVKRYADNLRIMRHEQLNWTATLAGLLHMQRYDEAIRYVEAQSEGEAISSRSASARRRCAACWGKYSSAREKASSCASIRPASCGRSRRR